VEKACEDVERFVVDQSSLETWSGEFFHAVAEKIRVRAADPRSAQR
jgi:hypothetical protein